jgi:hypothetical protein
MLITEQINSDDSSSVQEMEHLLDDLTKNIKAIITSGQDNLHMLNETKASIQKPSSHSEHQTADDLVMQRTKQILHGTVEFAILCTFL